MRSASAAGVVAIGPGHPAQCRPAATAERRVTRVHAAHRGERAASKRRSDFCAGVARRRVRAARRASAPAPSTRAIELAQPQEHVLIAGQPGDAARLQQLGEGVGASAAVPAPTSGLAASSASSSRPRSWKWSPRVFRCCLPAVAGDRHLHDLGGALVDRGDPDVALDLLDHVLVRVAVATVGLDGRVGGGVAGLGGQVLGDRALGVERALARRRCAPPSPRCRRAPPPAAPRGARSACAV